MPVNIQRRDFMKNLGVAGIGMVGLTHGINFSFAETKEQTRSLPIILPKVISTWDHGIPANKKAMALIQNGNSTLDAVEKGVNVCEDDPDIMSVGLGGLPDREGHVSLDACIMDQYGNAGAVAFIQGYKNAVSVARKVMEETDHVMLVGKGAEEFAKEMGFKKSDLLTEKAKYRWRVWLKDPKYPYRRTESPKRKRDLKEDHDTIGMLAIDKNGDLSGACTTSGLAYKMHGRVGDSPIIGAGMYVDNEIGGAAATGLGEECIKVCGSFLVVEFMRRGASPEEACKEVVKRIASRHSEKPSFQIAFIALNKAGEHGFFAMNKGFQAAVAFVNQNDLVDSDYLIH